MAERNTHLEDHRVQHQDREAHDREDEAPGVGRRETLAPEWITDVERLPNPSSTRSSKESCHPPKDFRKYLPNYK
jgi:hypothetical protein